MKEEAFATSTNRVRKSQWKKFYDFTRKWELQYIPVLPINVCRFLYEASNDLCYSSLNNYVSGFNLLSKLNNGLDLREDFGVSLMLKGLRRIKGDVSHPKEPLMPADLKSIFQAVNLSDHTELSVWVGVMVCFRTMLRKCHLFPSDGLDMHLLSRKHVKFTDWGMEVTVPTSKTDQFSQRAFVSPVTKSESELCAVSQLKLYWSRFGGNEHWPIISNCRGEPISYNVALRLLKKWCVAAGVNKDIGFHSLRRGAATHMYLLGVPVHDIKVEGDWQSLAVLLYLTTSLSHRISIDKKVSESLTIV